MKNVLFQSCGMRHAFLGNGSCVSWSIKIGCEELDFDDSDVVEELMMDVLRKMLELQVSLLW